MQLTSFNDPITEITNGHTKVRVYEEIPKLLTIVVSNSPGMWSGCTVPADSAHLVADAVSAALETRAARMLNLAEEEE